MNTKLLINPFEKYDTKLLLLAAALLTIAGAIMAYWLNARFDGAIDLHFAPHTTAKTIATDLIIAIGSLFLLLFLTGIAINRKTRFVDILIAVMLARFPLYLMTLFNYNNTMYDITGQILNSGNVEQLPDIPASGIALLMAFAVLGLLGLIWFCAMLFNGFRVATNAKGARHVVLFAAAVVLAEILSKMLLYILYTENWF